MKLIHAVLSVFFLLCTALHGFVVPQCSSQRSTVLFQSEPTTISKERAPIAPPVESIAPVEADTPDESSYIAFAQQYPFVNNVLIATVKAGAADLLAQTVIGGSTEIDVQRSLLFFLFGGLYSGVFQYIYQVQIFKRLFDVERFTEQTWSDKFKDREGLQALVAQTALDLTVLTLIYLPTFYVFKASVFSDKLDPSLWWHTGLENYRFNFGSDEPDVLRVWFPADLVCFSVPLYLRLPVRHVVSFAWTAYLSFARGGQ